MSKAAETIKNFEDLIRAKQYYDAKALITALPTLERQAEIIGGTVSSSASLFRHDMYMEQIFMAGVSVFAEMHDFAFDWNLPLDKRAGAWWEINRMHGFSRGVPLSVMYGEQYADLFYPYAAASKNNNMIRNLPHLLNNAAYLYGHVQMIYAVNDEKMLEKAIAEDAPSAFNIALTLTGKKVRKKMLQKILISNARKILFSLIKNRRLNTEFSFRNFLFWISAHNLADIGLLEDLNNVSPRLIAEAVDDLGNTPLWYMLISSRCGTPEKLQMEQFLIEHGCDPDRLNHIGLSYNAVAKYRETVS